MDTEVLLDEKRQNKQNQHQQADEGALVFAPEDGQNQLCHHNQPQNYINSKNSRLLADCGLEPAGRIFRFGWFLHGNSFHAAYCAAAALFLLW